MPLPQTEMIPDPTACIDVLAPGDALSAMLGSQLAAVDCVSDALVEIENGARLIAETIRAGKTLIYVAAGSSGLMALADSSELPGTFGIPQDQIRIVMAGGVPIDGKMPGGPEDDISQARTIASGMSQDDLIIALSASGETPFTCEIARQANRRGTKIIGIANNSGSALLSVCDIPICLASPPEILAGSTRMGAGTAQKVALNLMSTLAGVMLGHVYNGMMINLQADNDKLIRRSARIVSKILGISEVKAITALEAGDGDTKRAVLIASGEVPERAGKLLEKHGQNLRSSLAELGFSGIIHDGS